MKISSSNARIEVHDSSNNAWFDISRELAGYAADISFLPNVGKMYVAKRDGDPMIHILFVPRSEWKKDLELAGFIILGRLVEIIENATKTELK